MDIKKKILNGLESLLKNKYWWLSSWILICYGKKVTGQLTLSPMTVAPVCNVGDPLQITCTASVNFVRWSIVVTNEQGMEEEITVSRNSRDLSLPPRERIINSTKFTFSRISGEGDLPLVTTLAINSTSIGLNGTVVDCRDADDPMTSTSTTIQLIGITNNQYSSGPTVSIISEEYEVGNITVTVEWTQPLLRGVYSVRVIPKVPINYVGSTRAQLRIPYNIEYNLSIDATTPCRPNTTALIRLKYANCGIPGLFLWRVKNDSTVNVEGYDGLPIEGKTVMFSCPPGLELTGPRPNSATCTEEGQWELDSSMPMCIKSKGNFTMEFEESSSPESDELVVAVSSTVIVFLVISILTLVAGFASGYYFRGRKCNESYKKTQDSCTPSQPTVPLYEYVDTVPSTVEHQEQGLELKENVAYGPSKLNS